MTVAAIRDNGPVVVLRHKVLGLQAKGQVPDHLYTRADRQGGDSAPRADVTLVGIGRTTHVCLECAEQLEADGIGAEVIHLLTLNPLDEETILESVARTHRIVIVDEDTPVYSIVRDIEARVADKAFDHLDAPVKAVTAADTPVPFAAVLEAHDAPRVKDVLAAVRELFA